MKPELYTFPRVMDVLDRQLFFLLMRQKVIKRARGSPLLEFINVKCLVVISSLRWLLPPQGSGPEGGTRGGTLMSPE